MKEKEVTELTAQERIELFVQSSMQDAEKVEQDILLAIDDLRTSTGIPKTRVFLLEMMLKHASDPSTQIEDDDRLLMLQIFNVFNVA